MMRGTFLKFLEWNLIQVVNDDMFCPLKKCGCLCHWIIKNYRFYSCCFEESTGYLLLIHITAQKFHPCPNYTILNSSSALNSSRTKDQLPGIDWALQGAHTRRGRTGWKPFPPLVSNLLMIARGKYWKYCFCVKFATSSCQLFAKQLFPSVAFVHNPLWPLWSWWHAYPALVYAEHSNC